MGKAVGKWSPPGKITESPGPLSEFGITSIPGARITMVDPPEVKGKAKPGSMVTRRVSRGPGKGDLVKFTANSSSAQLPGKLVPKRVISDVKPKRRGGSLPIGKEKKE